MEILFGLGCGACAGGAAFVLVAGTTPPSAGVSQIRRLRALGRLRKLLASVASAPLLRALVARPAWRSLAADASGWAQGVGLELSEDEASGALLGGVACAALLGGVASRSVVGFVVVASACIAGIQVLRASRERRRAKALAEEMPAIFRTLSIAIGSGQTLSQAVEYVGTHESGPAGEEFARTSLRLRCGISAQRALAQLAEELSAPGVGLLVTALLISQRTGCPLRDLFLRSATLVERQGEFERTLAVKTAQVRLSVRIVCLLPVVMIAVLSLISPDFQQGLASPAGLGCVCLALAMDAAALVLIRTFLRGVV